MTVTGKDKKYIASTYARFPVELAEGCGSVVTDFDGKKYIDFGGGIAVNTFGYSDGEWAAAVAKQAATLSHTSNLYYTKPCADLAEMLCERTGMKKVFFSNSGAEANECAIKVARKYAHDKFGEGHSTIITLKNSFHGRTVTTLAATGQDAFHTDFMPFTEGFVYATANDTADLDRVLSDNAGKCAAIMVEFIQGEGGVCPLTAEYVAHLEKKARENGLLIIADEVQTGNGRTGKLYAYMNYDITPDIVSTAKGLAGGLPLGATMFAESTENVLSYGSHGSTFGGNPVCCAGALSILSRIDDKLMAEVAEKSEYIKNRLCGVSGVKSIDGMGLMLGIGLDEGISSKAVIAECMANGLLVLSAKTKIRLLPALNTPTELLAEGTEILARAIEKAANEKN